MQRTLMPVEPKLAGTGISRETALAQVRRFADEMDHNPGFGRKIPARVTDAMEKEFWDRLAAEPVRYLGFSGPVGDAKCEKVHIVGKLLGEVSVEVTFGIGMLRAPEESTPIAFIGLERDGHVSERPGTPVPDRQYSVVIDALYVSRKRPSGVVYSGSFGMASKRPLDTGLIDEGHAFMSQMNKELNPSYFPRSH